MANGLKLLSPPTLEPVSLATMKQHLTLDPGFTDDDDLILGQIAAARRDAEDYLGQALVPQQWLYALDQFPGLGNGYLGANSPFGVPNLAQRGTFGGFLERGPRVADPLALALPVSPVISIDSVQYADPASGSLQTLAPSQYQADLFSQPARLMPVYNNTWPVTAPVVNAVQVTFTAGKVVQVLLEGAVIPAAPGPYTVTLQKANATRILSVTYTNGTVIDPAQYAAVNGVLTFAPSLAGQSVLLNYQILALSPTTIQAIKLRAAAYYANREEFLAGTTVGGTGWFERMLEAEGRTNLFGVVEG